MYCVISWCLFTCMGMNIYSGFKRGCILFCQNDAMRLSVVISCYEFDEWQCFFPLFGVCVVCMWQCSLLFFLSILQPKLTSLICWHYRCVFCIVPQLQYFDMTKSQTISIKKIMANHNIVSLLNVFLAVYPPHRQTGFVFFFCPLVQHSPVLMDSVKLCGGGISPTAAYIFTGHCFLCEMQ